MVLLNQQAMLSYNLPLSNIVLMGMGEPLLNYDNVVKAMDLMKEITKHCSGHSIPLDTRRIILGIARSNPDLLRAVASMSMGAGA